MIAQLRSELRKLRTTRTNVGLALGLVAPILFGVVAGGFGGEADLSVAETQRELVGNGAFAALFAALIGVLATTSEFRHGTIRATLVVTPARTLVLGTGVALIRARGYDVLLDAGDVRRLVVGTTVGGAVLAAYACLFAVAGAGAPARRDVA